MTGKAGEACLFAINIQRKGLIVGCASVTRRDGFRKGFADQKLHQTANAIKQHGAMQAGLPGCQFSASSRGSHLPPARRIAEVPPSKS